MKGFLAMFGMSAGGWLGWTIGAPVSVFVAFLMSVVGTGVGLYGVQRFLSHYLP